MKTLHVKTCIAILLSGVSFATSSQIINTIAGIPFQGGYSGDGGPATAAELFTPWGVGLDASGNVYIADWENQRIRKVNASGIISTIAGNGYFASGNGGFSGDGGPATMAELNHPCQIVIDASRNVYIADTWNNRIRIINIYGTINTFAGGGSSLGDGGPAIDAELISPTGIALDASGNVYIADNYNQRIRKVNTSGVISTIAGNGYDAFGGGVGGYSGDGGPATAAELGQPNGVAVDASGNVYIAEWRNQRIRKVNTSGIISTIAGNGYFSSSLGGFSGDGGPATTAELDYPAGVAVDASGNVYIAEYFNDRIRIISTTGIINTYAGGGTSGIGDGGPATAAQLNQPTDVILDGSGNFYISEGSSDIRKVSASFGILAGTNANVSCTGESNGIISAEAIDGTPPYSYVWSPSGETTAIVSGLSAGIYTVTVTDNASLTTSTIVTITQPVALTASANTITNLGCNGGSNGSASSIGSGGTPPYTYSWSASGINTDTANGLSAGNYTVTVQDSCGSSATAAVIITQPTAILATVSVTDNVSCSGGKNAQARITVSGGISPYTYSWSPINSSTYLATGLSAGTYSVTISDHNGCTSIVGVTVTQPAPLWDSAGITYPACRGGTGSASIAVTGGTSPYTYTWSPNVSTTNTAAGLTARSYVVLVKDADGCTYSINFSITQPAPLRDSIVRTSISNVSCNGESTGYATVGVKYGTPPYTYSWNGGSGIAATDVGMSAGTYIVTVTDSCGNSATTSVIITEPSSSVSMSINSSASITNISCNGAAWVIAHGGIAPYTYSWTGGFSTTDSIKNQCAGNYCCIVTDANGCTDSLCVTIPISTGIDNINNSSLIHIYPNPTMGNFMVSGLTDGQTIELYNYLGQKVLSAISYQPSANFDISDKANGVYFIRIINKDGSVATQMKVLKTQ